MRLGALTRPRRFIRRVVPALLAALAVSSCGGKTPQAGLEVIIATSGLRVGADIDAVEAVVKQETSPGTWHQLFDVTHRVPDEVTLPTTLAIEPGTSPDQDALIVVTGLRGGVPVVQRVVQTQVPTHRVAELVMILAGDCLDKITLCAPESCQPATGTCGPNMVSPATLPTYVPGDEARLDAGNLVADAGGEGGADVNASVGNSDGSGDATEATLGEGGDATTDAGSDAIADAVEGGDGDAYIRPIGSPGCGKTWPGATGMWVSQPTGCTNGGNNQGTALCQAIPPGSTVPAKATQGSPEYRGWWVYVPTGYDASKPYTLIFEGTGEFDANWFDPGRQGYPFQSVDSGQAIQVGLDYPTFSLLLGGFDGYEPQSNDLLFFPWLMSEIEKTFCVDTGREFFSGYDFNGGGGLAAQLNCVMPAKLRATMTTESGEPGSCGSDPLGSKLPTCNPAPIAALFVHDIGDTSIPHSCDIPSCARMLKQNGCSNTKCDPSDPTLTTDYTVPVGVNLTLASGPCVEFKGCPAAYPVVFCSPNNTTGNHHGDGTQWGVTTLFWDFMNRLNGVPRTCSADTSTDPNNCGSCGNLCAVGATCQGGACVCPGGESVCRGVCVDEQTDLNNCGACATSCAGGICQAGTCVCPGGDSLCPGGCVNKQTDNGNCGGCGTKCPAGGGCQTGTCACPIGQTACNGTCVDLQTDRANCGLCFAVCGGNLVCQSGQCACPVGSVCP